MMRLLVCMALTTGAGRLFDISVVTRLKGIALALSEFPILYRNEMSASTAHIKKFSRLLESKRPTNLAVSSRESSPMWLYVLKGLLSKCRTIDSGDRSNLRKRDPSALWMVKYDLLVHWMLQSKLVSERKHASSFRPICGARQFETRAVAARDK